MAHVTKNLESDPENSRYSAYMQDAWNVARRLTLNIGLRYELEGLFQNGRGDLANFYPALGKIVLLSGAADPRFAGLPIVDGPSVHLGPSNYLYRDWNNFAPRLGFAYRPFGSTRFVVRSSYGIFYDVIGGYIGYTGLANNPPFRVVESFEPLAGATPPLTFARSLPGPGTHSAQPQIQPLAPH